MPHQVVMPRVIVELPRLQAQRFACRCEPRRIEFRGCTRMAELDEVKRDVAIANRILAHVGLATGVTASLGHASLRVPSDPNLFVVKGRGYEMDVLSYMRPQDMVVCDL